MATLTSTKIKNTYDALLKASDNDAIGSSAKQITDGLGNSTPLYISTTQIGIGVTPEATYDLHVYSNAKVGGNLTITGDLTVNGTTTTVDTDTLRVEDPLIEVARNNTSTDSVDIGIYGKYAPSATTLYAGLFRDAGDDKFKLFKSLEEQPTTTVNTSGTGYTVATLVSNLEGNVTGDLTGNVTGNLSGNVTGGTISGTTGTFSGNVDIDGTLDVDDVISVEGSGFGRIEVGGASGGYIDLKAPNSDDYDFRLITSTGGAELYSIDTLKFYTGATTDLAITIDASQDVTFEGNIILSGTVDGRDVSADGSKLDGIEAGADVTDTANVRSAGALMDDELTNISAVKAINQQLTTTSNVQFTSVTSDLTGNVTGNADTATKIASITNSNIVQLTDTQTLTNKTIDADNNTISDLEVDNLKAGVLDTDLTSVSASDDTLASAKAIKTYVDNQVGSNNELSEVLANGNTTGGTNIDVSAGDDINLSDTSEIHIGDDNDLVIKHNGTQSFINNNTGQLNIYQLQDDGDIKFFNDDGAGGTENYLQIDGGETNIKVFKTMRFSDNVELRLGTGSDLRIYHDGSNSYINETGTGVLSIQSDGTEVQINKGASEYMGRFITDAGVKLYYDNSLKFETTSTGVSVTGEIVVDGSGTFDTLTLTSGNDNLTFTQSSDDWTINNAQQNNGITIYDGATGVDINYNGSSYFEVDATGVHTAANIDFYVDTNLIYADATNNLVGIGKNPSTYKLDVNGKIASDDYIIAGLGNGGVALTHNDGQGNANVTFNHVAGIPEQNGNSFRIIANTDSSTNAYMAFEMAVGVTSGVQVSTGEVMRLDETGVKVRNTGGGILHLERDDASIVDGNPLGRLRFTGDDPVNGTFNRGVEIRAEASGTWSTDNYPSELQFYTTATNTDELALTLDSSQNATFAGSVSATTTNLTGALNIDSALPTIKLTDTDTSAYARIRASNGGLLFEADESNTQADSNIRFEIDTDEKMRIDSSGNVGIGTTSPGSRRLNIVTSDSGNDVGFESTISRTSGSNYGIRGLANGSGATTNIGGFFQASGATTNRALWAYVGHVLLATQNTNDYVGIGTESPGAKLDVNSSAVWINPPDGSHAGLHFRQGSAFKGFVGYNDSTDVVNLSMDGSIVNGINVNASHNVGIGTDSPSNKLDVKISTANRTTLEPVMSVSAEGSGPYTGFGPKISFSSNIYYGAATGNPAGIIETAYVGAVMGTTYATNSDLVFATRDGATSVTEKMRILGNGNVGIGTTSPVSTHRVTIEADSSNGTSQLYLKRDSTDQGLYIDAGAGSAIYNSHEGTDTIYGRHIWESTKGTDTVERMRIDSSGRVGIGTTSPSSLLHIQGSTYNRVQTYFDGSYTSGFKFSDLNGGIWYDAGADDLYLNANHSNSQVILQSGGSTTLTLDASNNATFAGQITATQITATNGLNYLKRNTDASLQLRSENTRSGLFITKPATDTVMGSALVLADESYRLGTASYYHMYMLQNGNTYFTQNVGIGTTSPDYKLEVQGVISSADSGLQKSTFANVGNDLVLTANADATNVTANILFKSSGSGGASVTEKMRIDSLGQVMIGTTTTQSKLEVRDTKTGSFNSPHFTVYGNGYGAFHWLDTSAYHIFTNSSSRNIEVIANTNGVRLNAGATSWVSNSDISLKENIKPLENVLDKIKDYRCVEYNFKDDEVIDKKIGFIAQDWENDFSAVVSKDKNEKLGIKYTETIPVLLKAIQELKAEIELLKTQINN